MRVRKPNKKKTINIKYTSWIIITIVILLFYCWNNITNDTTHAQSRLDGFFKDFLFIFTFYIWIDKLFRDIIVHYFMCPVGLRTKFILIYKIFSALLIARVTFITILLYTKLVDVKSKLDNCSLTTNFRFW